MVNSAIAHALETLERRSDDVRALYRSGARPSFDDTASTARIEVARDPLSIVPPEGAYLVVGDPAHPSYTRDGALQIRDGVLVASDGAPVLGVPAGAESHGPPQRLRIDARDAAAGRSGDVRVDSDGTFGYSRTVVDRESLERRVERVTVGRVSLARFPSGTAPVRVDALHARAPAGVVPLLGLPADGRMGALWTYSRAWGGIDAAAGIGRLQEAYLSASALGALERARTAMQRGALDLVK